MRFLPCLTAHRGRLLSEDEETGQPVFAGSFLRKREIVLDSALLDDAGERARILLHELFHFVWLRLGNPGRREWSLVLEREFSSRARGELGWSSEWRKRALLAADCGGPLPYGRGSEGGRGDANRRNGGNWSSGGNRSNDANRSSGANRSSEVSRSVGVSRFGGANQSGGANQGDGANRSGGANRGVGEARGCANSPNVSDPLLSRDRKGADRHWRDYVCESFCDTSAWMYADIERHDEFTLAPRWTSKRRGWFEKQFSERTVRI